MPTYYVSPAGDDMNPGDSPASPWRLFSKALPLMQPHDTLLLLDGVYTEAITSNAFTIPSGSTWDNAPRIAAAPGATPVLRPFGNEVINLAHSYIQYLIFENLEVDAVNGNYGVSLANDAHHIRLINLDIHRAGLNGVSFSKGAPAYSEILGGRIHDNPNSHGLYITSSNNVFRGVEVDHNGSFGFHIFSAFPEQRANNNLVDRCHVHHNSLVKASSAGILLSTGDGNMAINNLVHDEKAGIRVNNNHPTNSTVLHNTVYAADVGIEVTSLSTSAEVINNIVYASATAAIIDTGVTSTVSNNLTTDPSFVDAASNDFHLQASSLAIDAGATLPTVLEDYDLRTRPDGAHSDIGAFEYNATNDAPVNVLPGPTTVPPGQLTAVPIDCTHDDGTLSSCTVTVDHGKCHFTVAGSATAS